MKKQEMETICQIDYKKIKDYAQVHFARLCPSAGSMCHQEEQERILGYLKEKYDETLKPKVVLQTYENPVFDKGMLQVADTVLRCPELVSYISDIIVKQITFAAISISVQDEEEMLDILEYFYLDCWKTALLDGTRQWLKEWLYEVMNQGKFSVSAFIGPGFYGIPVEMIREFIKLSEAQRIGVKEFYGGLYPFKTVVGLYISVKEEQCSPVERGKAAVSMKEKDCKTCIGSKNNCLFCMKY